jgi:hypothetical protein
MPTNGSAYGNSGAWMKALYARFGCHATGISFKPSYGVSGSVVTLTGVPGNAVSMGSTVLDGLGMPSQPKDSDGVTLGPSWGYVAPGATAAASGVLYTTAGVTKAGDTVGGHRARWRFWYCYPTFTTAGGSFRPFIRRNAGGYDTIATSPVISTQAASEGKVLGYLDAPADATRTVGMEFRWAPFSASTVTGPFGAYWSRAENLDATAGISVHRLYGVGGNSLYDMAAQLKAWSDVELRCFFEETRRLQLSQGQKPIVVVCVNSGLNDQNETLQPSLGWRANAAPTSALSYVDNLEALMKRVEDIWQSCSGSSCRAIRHRTTSTWRATAPRRRRRSGRWSVYRSSTRLTSSARLRSRATAPRAT